VTIDDHNSALCIQVCIPVQVCTCVYVQVNGEDVTSDDHEGVVAKIKAMPNEVHLLVADALTYEHFKLSDDDPKSETELFIEVIACHDEPGMNNLATVFSPFQLLVPQPPEQLHGLLN